jgi:hypothetical protein
MMKRREANNTMVGMAIDCWADHQAESDDYQLRSYRLVSCANSAEALRAAWTIFSSQSLSSGLKGKVMPRELLMTAPTPAALKAD